MISVWVFILSLILVLIISFIIGFFAGISFCVTIDEKKNEQKEFFKAVDEFLSKQHKGDRDND